MHGTTVGLLLEETEDFAMVHIPAPAEDRPFAARGAADASHIFLSLSLCTYKESYLALWRGMTGI